MVVESWSFHIQTSACGARIFVTTSRKLVVADFAYSTGLVLSEIQRYVNTPPSIPRVIPSVKYNNRMHAIHSRSASV